MSRPLSGLAVAALLLGGCDPAPAPPADNAAPAAAPAAPPASPQPPADSADAPMPALAVEGEGLRLFDRETGSARPLPFGTPRAQVLAALAFRGPPGTGVNGECGAGPLAYANWPDGLGLFFQADKFAGWNLDRRTGGAITTADGIGPGITRAQFDERFGGDITVSQTTLGSEFEADPYFGLLDGPGPNARITNMWAGVSCVFR